MIFLISDVTASQEAHLSVCMCVTHFKVSRSCLQTQCDQCNAIQRKLQISQPYFKNQIVLSNLLKASCKMQKFNNTNCTFQTAHTTLHEICLTKQIALND